MLTKRLTQNARMNLCATKAVPRCEERELEAYVRRSWVPQEHGTRPIVQGSLETTAAPEN